MTRTKVLVTSSAGHLGEVLTRVPRGRGYQVTGLDLRASPSTDLTGHRTGPGAGLPEGTVPDRRWFSGGMLRKTNADPVGSGRPLPGAGHEHRDDRDQPDPEPGTER